MKANVHYLLNVPKEERGIRSVQWNFRSPFNHKDLIDLCLQFLTVFGSPRGVENKNEKILSEERDRHIVFDRQKMCSRSMWNWIVTKEKTLYRGHETEVRDFGYNRSWRDLRSYRILKFKRSPSGIGYWPSPSQGTTLVEVSTLTGVSKGWRESWIGFDGKYPEKNYNVGTNQRDERVRLRV